MFFVTDGDCHPLTLGNILEFASGASRVPPLGFGVQPEIQFLRDGTRKFPEANTCAVILSLPTHSTYKNFKEHMMEGILSAPTFGQA